MNVLVVDVGGTHIKVLVTGETEHRKSDSGPAFTAEQMVAAAKLLAAEWRYDVVTIGCPGPVMHGKPADEPIHLGTGWVGFDFEAAFGCPVKIINDAAMQALGSYEGGKMLFLGLGTGLGTAMVVDGLLIPMELGHLPYRKRTFEDYVGTRGMERVSRKKWRKRVAEVVALLQSALLPDYIVLGGGNVKELEDLPPGCRLGNNANAFEGGFRLWSDQGQSKPAVAGRIPR